MATYKFSELNFQSAAVTIPAVGSFTTTDLLIFDVESISAADLQITTIKDPVTAIFRTEITVNSQIITLAGFTQDKISSANITFADGSLLIIGDGKITNTDDPLANTIEGSDYDDYLDGLDGVDTVTYAKAQAGVTVNLTNTAKQDTFGAGLDKLLHIENLIGSVYNDTLIGDDNANRLDGGAGGIDILSGGAGNDTYVVSAFDVVTEGFNAGSDTVISATDYALGANLEDLTLNTGALIGIGNTLANTIMGNTGNNILDGGLNSSGFDTLIGGTGNDTYVVNQSGDVVTEALNAGTDLVQSFSTNYTLANNVENLRLMGVTALNGTGNSLGNIIYANKGNNGLDGGLGTDTVSYQFGASSGIIASLTNSTVTGGSGADTISNFENIIGTRFSDSITGDGANNTIDAGAGNDLLDGGAGNDTLTGGVGNDRLEGGAGNDTLIGGLGDDTYVIDSAADVVTEIASQGTDTILSKINLSLVATAFSAIDNLTLIDTAVTGTGNSLANILIGNDLANTLDGGAGNDFLDGGTGNDTLIGGAGDDTFVVDAVGDVVNEQTNAGTKDTIQTNLNYSLASLVNIENLILSGTGAINGTGNDLANIITGNSNDNVLIGGLGNDNLTALGGNDFIDGGIGSDTMAGSLGNDTYVIDSIADIINEIESEGTDTVQSSITYTLSDVAGKRSLENLTLTGAGVINGTGNSLDNILLGNSAANTLTGGAGNDFLDGGAGGDKFVGGAGDDTFMIDNIADTVTENASEGTDTVKTSVNVDFSALSTTNVENIILLDGAAINATGGDVNNVITGNDAVNVLTGNGGNDLLNGGGDADTLAGGAGDDTYIVDNIADVIIEAASAGTDVVQASVSFALNDTDSIGVENLTLTGLIAINATGNSLANTIIANSNDNFLDGGAGADTLIGGLGNDTYIVDDSLDTVTEAASAGVDFVQASATFTLSANIENLTLTGSAVIDGTGNTLNNTLMGNSAANTLTGDAGDDTLDGGMGADTLIGGAGNDTYVVDDSLDVITEAASAGTDLVQTSASFALNDTTSVGVENLTLTGGGNINGTGNSLANTITGNSGNNILDGGIGADTLVGGLGDDTYVVDNAGDVITEAASAGTELVQTSVTFTLGTNLENLTLIGASAINGTGNALNNVLVGNDAVNSLTGNGGNDTLDGGLGADTLAGGGGNDTYVVDNTSDVVTEASSSGIDLVQASATFTLSANVENLTLTGASAINGTGNGLGNTIIGNSGNNILDGLTGTDTLSGGLGNDTYVVDNIGDIVTEAAGEGVDVVQTGISYTLTAEIEKLTLTGTGNINGTGNVLANIIMGNSGSNILDGGTGADALTGGAGSDTYMVDNAGDVITEVASAGTDLVQASVSFALNDAGSVGVDNLTLTGLAAISGTGNSLANILTGNTSSNLLDGGIGADTLVGGLGDDTYVVDNAGDVITEAASEGTDLVQAGVTFALNDSGSVGVDNLTLTGASAINGTGNSLANILTGNDANNLLDGGSGADTLNGGIGADTLIGGLGDDTYVVDNAGDVITEASSAGTDLVQAGVTFALNDSGSVGVDNLTLTGVAAINGTGNSLNNIILGNGAANTLTGNAGNDTLTGGAGRDILITGIGNDTVVFGAGVTDTVATASSIAGVDLCSDLLLNAALSDKIDLTVAVASIGTANTGSISQGTFISNMNTLLTATSKGFKTATSNLVDAAVVTANAGDLSGKSFLAIDLDGSNTFTATDFVIEITGSTVLSLTTATFI